MNGEQLKRAMEMCRGKQNTWIAAVIRGNKMDLSCFTSGYQIM